MSLSFEGQLSGTVDGVADAALDAVAEIPDVDLGPINIDLGALAGAATKAKLISMKPPFEAVIFDLNPEELKVSYSSSFDNRKSASGKANPGGVGIVAAVQGHQPAQYTGSQPVKLSFKGIFDQDYATELIDLNPLGEDSVRRRIDLLGSWCRPEPGLFEALAMMAIGALSSAAGLGSIVNILRSPPLVTFQWGDPFNGGFVVQGYVKSVNAVIKRFSAGGNPLRAEVSIDFQEEPQGLLGMLQNPTSGGIPGRRAHTVCEGENLQRIAVENYGQPHAWRQLAEANGIDDPMRVRPGRQVMMPAPAELGS